MTFVFASQFHVYLPWVNTSLVYCLNSVLNVKALIGEGLFPALVTITIMMPAVPCQVPAAGGRGGRGEAAGGVHAAEPGRGGQEGGERPQPPPPHSQHLLRGVQAEAGLADALNIHCTQERILHMYVFVSF